MDTSYNTLLQALNGLIQQGYHLTFDVLDEKIACHSRNKLLPPREFKIDKIHRFDGISDPYDQSILYAISCPKYDMKGTIINGYGISADTDINDVMVRLSPVTPVHKT